MRWTNATHLPDYVVNWLTTDDYDYNNDEKTISATSLMKPAKSIYLTRIHADDIEMEVTDMCAVRYGTAIHML